MTNATWLKLLAVFFGSLLVAGLIFSYAMRGTEGIAAFLVLAVAMVILFAWRTH